MGVLRTSSWSRSSSERLHIPVLPSIVTAVLITTIVSAGNAYTFNASRSLHALALEGQAPKFLRRLNNKGVPYLAVIVVMALACLVFLALGSTSAKLLHRCNYAELDYHGNYMDLIQHPASNHTPVIGRFAAHSLFCGKKPDPLSCMIEVAETKLRRVQGYAVFLSANWSTATFIVNYSIIALAGSIGLGWKLFKKTRFHRASEVDLISHLYFFDVLTEHYRHEREAAPQNLKDKILAKIF
ncbi:hypothetical protein FOBRF1_014190 [Fusarium oxysporum]